MANTKLIVILATVYFALSDATEWTTLIHTFHQPSFYNNIIDQFKECPDDPWVEDTLEYLNRYVSIV